MRAGKLRHRIVIQQNTTSQSGTGAHTDSWAALATVWAAIEPLRGREFMEAKGLYEEAAVRFRIRHRTDLNTEQRVSWDSRFFDITAVIPVNQNNREIWLMTREIN